jgi:hypothetical protein
MHVKNCQLHGGNLNRPRHKCEIGVVSTSHLRSDKKLSEQICIIANQPAL